MEAGGIFFDGFNENDDEIFESSATHAETPNVIAAE